MRSDIDLPLLRWETLFRQLIGVTLCLAAFSVSGCFPSLAGDSKLEVVDRVSSPDGTVEIVVELVAGGATVSSTYVLYIGPTGFAVDTQKKRSAYRMGSIDSAVTDGERGVLVSWISDREVEVRCSSHRRFFENQPSISISGRSYSIRWRLQEKAAEPGATDNPDDAR